MFAPAEAIGEVTQAKIPAALRDPLDSSAACSGAQSNTWSVRCASWATLPGPRPGIIAPFGARHCPLLVIVRGGGLTTCWSQERGGWRPGAAVRQIERLSSDCP